MLEVSTGRAAEVNTLLEALARGRGDVAFYSDFFLDRRLHDAQVEFVTNAEAKINALATANRWGKTTVLCVRHFHRGTYKVGAEHRYMNEDGTIDHSAFLKLKYRTVHTAGEWEQASLVWEDALLLIAQNPRLKAFVFENPRSKPPHIGGINSWKWEFRTLGVNASNIDGKSIYLLTIDEAGWITNLDEMLRNVLRVRTADVRGVIDIVGTFKPGISRDFYKVSVRASAYTGRGIDFAHGTDEEEDGEAGGANKLDLAIDRYLAEFGIDITEYRDALERGIHDAAA